jgi:hypothetical protein
MALSEAEQKVLDEAAVFWTGQDPALAARLRGGGWGRVFIRGGFAAGGCLAAIMVSLVLAVGLLALGLPAQALVMMGFGALGFALRRRHRRPAGPRAGRGRFGGDSARGTA